MKILCLLLGLVASTCASANTKADKVPFRMPAQNTEQDPDVQKAIERVRKHFEQTGSFVYCTSPNDISESMAMLFDKPYRVTHMTTLPSAASSNSVQGGKVCVAIEKK